MIFDELDRTICYLAQKNSACTRKSELAQTLFADANGHNLDTILQHMIDQKHVFETLQESLQEPGVQDREYAITIRGIIFLSRAEIKNRPYYCTEEQNKNEKKNFKMESWPKRNWLIVALITFSLGSISSVISEWGKRKIWPESFRNNVPASVVKHDTPDSSAIRKK